MESGRIAAGSGRALRLDPFSLPVRFEAADESADGRRCVVDLHRERVVLRRSVRGMRMALNMPVTAFRGIAIRLPAIDPGKADQSNADSADRHRGRARTRRSGALSVPLFSSPETEDIVAEWQSWGRVLGLPLLVAEGDGRLREPFARLGRCASKRRPGAAAGAAPSPGAARRGCCAASRASFPQRRSCTASARLLPGTELRFSKINLLLAAHPRTPSPLAGEGGSAPHKPQTGEGAGPQPLTRQRTPHLRRSPLPQGARAPRCAPRHCEERSDASYARSASFGGFKSAEARSAKVEAIQFPAPSKWTWIASLALAMTNRSRTAFAPEFCKLQPREARRPGREKFRGVAPRYRSSLRPLRRTKHRSPDGAKRNPGTNSKLLTPFPDYASLHPGYEEEKRKRNADKR